MTTREPRTTIGLRVSTKQKMDKNRAPGQCYDGFLCQLIDMWQEQHQDNHYSHRYMHLG